MTNIVQELEAVFGKNRIRLDEPMSAHTTFKIGGPAEYYIDLEKTEDIVKAIQITNKLGIPFFIFGGGSNIIVSDAGIKGLVVKNNCRKFELLSMGGTIKNQKVDYDKAYVSAESGAMMSQLVRFCVDEGLGGLEYQLGLPGTVGGAVCMNSNFPLKGVYVGDCIYRATLVTPTGEIKEVDRDYFAFAYDKSILQETKEIVLSVVFKLTPGDKKELWEKATEALAHRGESQPKGASAGCTFRNISTEEAQTAKTPNQITSAGYLVDQAGLKGTRIGDAMISDMHANFILNKGGAKAEDVVALLKLMKSEVLKKFGVHLLMEVKEIGF